MNRLISCIAVAVFLLLVARAAAAEENRDSRLWYRQPASRWEEALPIGNGRLGAMIYGGIEREQVQLNESTIWAGAPKPRRFEPRTPAYVRKLRELLVSGDVAAARDLKLTDIPAPATQPDDELAGLVPPEVPNTSRCVYEPLGDLFLDFDLPPNRRENYTRSLDLSTALATTEFTSGATTYRRTMFASEPAQVIAIRLEADGPDSLTFRLSLDRRTSARADVDRYATSSEEKALESMLPPPPILVTARDDGSFEMRGQASDGGTSFVLLGNVAVQGGRIEAIDGKVLKIVGARSATILLSAATDYRQFDPPSVARTRLDAAKARTFDDLGREHIADHRTLFDRCTLDLGHSSIESLPTDRRLQAVQLDVIDPRSVRVPRDPALIALYFQYGRYLMIAGSRKSSPLPMALQGIWNDSLLPPWFGLFTSDINQEMNYWPAGPTNLEECREPQLRFVEFLKPAAERAARHAYGARGWVLCGMTIWGPKTYSANWTEAGPWMALEFIEHYRFTGDADFLRSRAYPVLRGACEFYLDWLAEDPKTGLLHLAPAYSPENGFKDRNGVATSLSASPTMSIAIIRELFNAYLECESVLNADATFADQIRAARDRLPPYKVGRFGQLQEWIEDFDEIEPGHRHNSHLFGLYPGTQIVPGRTDATIVDAARMALRRRLDNHGGWTGWSRAWLLNCAARLGDGELAGACVYHLLGKLTFPNLFDAHPRRGGDIAIFQIDGNFGATAGIAEMLLQSHAGEVHLLPALPSAWKNGRVTGLVARGGASVDMAWNEGGLTSASVVATRAGDFTIRYRDDRIRVTLQSGQRARVGVVNGKLAATVYSSKDNP
jgi:alpha-L-fucosidase 2